MRLESVAVLMNNKFAENSVSTIAPVCCALEQQKNQNSRQTAGCLIFYAIAYYDIKQSQ